jgi:phosphocarrier protein HPr
MAQRTVVVASQVGLHARPAKLFTQAAAAAPVKVTIAKGDGPAVDAASILRVMALAVKHGDEVTIAAEGAGADDVLDRLAEMLATDLDAVEA